MPKKPIMRPWALAVPILVLLTSLPLLRPLRHPDANEVSDDEAARLATVAAIVQHHRLALEDVKLGPGVPVPNTGLIRSHDLTYSNQPPVMAVLLAGPYWMMTKFGWTFDTSPILTPYILTLLGVTIPVAGAAGLIYKMGRLFQLPRPLRCALAAVVVFGGGLITYAVAMNSHAPAAALVLVSIGCLIYVANSRKPRRNIWWLLAAGSAAGLAMVIDAPAVVFPLALLVTIFAMRWPIYRRAAGAGLFILGVVPPLYLHLALNYPITGDYKPALLHKDLTLVRTGQRSGLADWSCIGVDLTPIASLDADPLDDPPAAAPASELPTTVVRPSLRLLASLVGSHGILTHFPVVLLGVLGMISVLRRNWPAITKLLALACLAGAVVVVVAYAFTAPDSRGAGFANRWFVVFMPAALFWIGAWVRRPHRAVTWAAAGVLLGFSVAVSLVGATDPLPRGGYDRYTAAAAMHRFLAPSAATKTPMASLED